MNLIIKDRCGYIFKYIPYLLLVISAFLLTLLHIFINNKDLQIDKATTQIKEIMFADSHIIGKDIANLKVYSIEKYKDIPLPIEQGVIIYANSKGCAKCLKYQLELSSNYKNNDKIVCLFNFYTENEVIAAKNEYNLGKEVYWDKDNMLDKLLNIDLQKAYPLILYVKKGLIIKYKFVTINKKEDMTEIIETINSYM
jgi:hypothetical protein